MFHVLVLDNKLMTGRSISSPTCSRSLKPSMSGMLTSLITMSYPSFLSRSKFKASLARPHVVTAKKKNERREKTEVIRMVSNFWCSHPGADQLAESHRSGCYPVQ